MIIPRRSVIFVILIFERYVFEEEPDYDPQKQRNSDVACYAAVKEPGWKAHDEFVLGWIAAEAIGRDIPPYEEEQVKTEDGAGLSSRDL